MLIMETNNLNKNDKILRYKRSSMIRLTIIGALFVCAGIVIFLGNIGVVNESIIEHLFSLELLLIVLGVIIISGNKNSWLISLMLILSGVLLLYHNVYNIPIDFSKVILPILLIGIGFSIFINILKPKKSKSTFANYEKHNADETTYYNPDFLIIQKVFSNINIAKKDRFSGGNLELVFSGGTLNLSNAELSEDLNILKIECVFSGLKIIVPRNWDIIIETTGFAGGLNDKRPIATTEYIDKTKKLVINADIVFGGIELFN